MENLNILKEMDIVRLYASKFLKLRNTLKIPLRQPLLDFYIQTNKDTYIFSYTLGDIGYLNILLDEINIYQEKDKNSNLLKRDYYYGLDVIQPKDPFWEIYKDGNIEVGLYTKIPKWLKDIGENRKKERNIILKKIAQNLN